MALLQFSYIRRYLLINSDVTSCAIVYKTFRSAKKLPNTFLYLLSYFIFSDGVGTVASVGVLFGTEELGLEGIGLVIIAALVPLSALIGKLQFDLRPFTSFVKIMCTLFCVNSDLIIFTYIYSTVL